MTITQPKRFIAAALMVLSTSLWGCGVPRAPLAMGPTMMPAAAVRTLSSPGEQAFRAELQRRKIRLSEEQIALIRDERRVMPNGTFAPRPAAKLSAQENLDVHFKKHGHEFRLTSADAYLQQATAFAAGQRGEIQYFYDTTSFQKGYQTHVVRWNPKSREFACVKTDGALTTYYTNDTLSSQRFVPVPAM